MDYTVVSHAKMPEFIEAVNKAIEEGWVPLEGGFQVQNFADSATRYLQAMVKVYPWSIKAMMQKLGPPSPDSKPILIEAKKEAQAKKPAPQGKKTKSQSKKNR